ncbi:MAG: TonB-dependent receptor [Opitutaceae bacterium]|nr:TonB-dependent receptor [Opitutaceae bacterium]
MNTHPDLLRRRRPSLRRLFQAVIVSASLTPVVTPCLVAAEATATAAGVVTGIVTNKTTGNGLIGARVEIPTLNRAALVDDTGRFILNGIPAGSHEVVVTYSGLDTQRTTVSVTAGQAVLANFEMSSSVLMLDAFKVASQKEGLSAALTQQRNADNLKNVASMDALADLPNMNATELAIRLPGVTFADPGDEVVEQISVRGMGGGMTSITIDGGGMSSFSAQGRTTRMTAFTGNMFESLELTKGQTPDRSVDSLGGGVNFKTRSPLSMREKRRIVANFTARQAPSFSEQVPLREKRRTHALFNASYTEKFAIFGSGEENLAVSVNAFYSENAFGFFRTVRDYQQTNTEPAYLWDYRTTDNYNNRVQRSLSTKWDYRLSRNSLIKLNLIYNDAPEPMRRQYTTRAFAGSQTTVPNATNSGVVPGFTSRITTVRAVPTAANATSGTTAPALIDVTSTLINRDQRLRHMDIGGEHNFGPFDIDWAGLHSRTRYRYLGAEGSLVNRIGNVPYVGPNGRFNNVAGTAASPLDNIVGPNGETGVGWILDRTESDLYPRFIQNGGLDFTNPNNYRPTVNGLSTQSGNLDIDLIKEARANFRYKLPTDSITAFVKTGASIRDHTVELLRVNRRWNYIGRTTLPTDPSILTWDTVKTGRKIPMWEAAEFIQQGQPTNQALWQEDKYYYYNNRHTASNKVNEVITGYYAMTQGRIGRAGFLGGLRRETTDTTGEGRRRARVLSTAAQQLADPEGSAERDSVRYKTEGTYSQNFPSVHLWYDILPDMKARAAWTTGFARPTLANYVTALSFNDPNQTVTFGNPDLKPTRSTNWDLSLEYYFKNSSSLTIGWFHKKLEDYIADNQEVGTVAAGPDNGFDGEFAGYTILARSNVGTAYTQGWEISYIQQFRFLPGLLKGLRLNANMTQLTAHGDYGGTTYLKDKEVNGFIPRTINCNLAWDYLKFGVSVSYNYNSESIRGAYNVTQPSRNRYMKHREIVNMNFRYQVRRNLTANFGVANVFNEPQRYYRNIPDQMETFLIQGTTITAGLEGRF